MPSPVAADETQVLDSEDPGADPAGETQRVDDEDTVPIDLWGETQVVDDGDTAAVAADSGGGTERTEVLSDDEGLQDDAATSGGGGGEDMRCGGKGETEAISCGGGCVEEMRRGAFEGDTEAVVDSDADGGGECMEEMRCGAFEGDTEAVVDSDADGGGECMEEMRRGALEGDTEAVADSDADGGGECMEEMRCSAFEGDTEAVVDSDATTDEEGGDGRVSSASLLTGGSNQSNHGSVKKSFATVRAASLRSSGLAAARSIIPKMIDTVATSSFSTGKDIRVEDTTERVQNSKKWPNGTPNTSHGTGAVELDPGLMLENSNGCNQGYHKNDAKHRGNNPRVKRLFNEVPSPGSKEPACNTDHVIGTVNSTYPNYAVGGLSYIGSQEPGDMSQANALDIVDEFLLVNIMESSQETKSYKKDLVKSPPVVGSKGTQSLARKADNRSPVGKAEIFEWIDSQEDDRGGEFFSKIKDTFFENSSARKSHTQPPKARRYKSEARGLLNHNGPRSKANLELITRSESRLVLGSTSGNTTIDKFETKSKKSLFKNMDEPLSTAQKLQTNDVGGCEGGNYDVGPDTQMAAEAMEELLNGDRDNCKIGEDIHLVVEKVSKNYNEGATKKKRSANNTTLGRISTSDSEGIATRSKRRNVVCEKPRRGRTDRSKKLTSNSRAEKTPVITSVGTNALMKSLEVEGHLDVSSSVNRNGNVNGKSRSLTRKKALGTVDKTPIMNPDNDPSSVTWNTTPVARRTRQSRAISPLKKNEPSTSKYVAEQSELIDVRAYGAVRKEDKLAAGESVPSKRKKSIIASDEITKIEKETPCCTDTHDTGGLQLEEPKTCSPINGFIGHPKRRRTSRSIPPNSNIGSMPNNPSVCIDGVPTTDVLPSTRQGTTRRYIRSVSEILTAKMQKKRSISARKASKTSIMTSDSGKLERSGANTRLSVDSPSIKPASAKEFKESPAKVLHNEVGSTNAANNCSTVLMSRNVDVERNAKVDVSPKEKVQSEPSYTTPSKTIDDASPACMAQDSTRTPCSKPPSRSAVRRELIRLESTEALPTLFKDSRRRNYMSSVRVLFSNHLDDDTIKQQKKILARLGVQIASSMSEASHFVTDKFVRTRNMLEAMVLGKPIVTHLWLESCGQASCFIDEKKYILRDVKKEKEIGFSMPVSLARACQFPLLQDRRVLITPNTKPGRELIASLVKASHGQPLERIGRSATKDDKIPDDLLVISTEEDYYVCKPLLEKGIDVFSAELILNGIVIQKLEYERHRLFADRVKQTRSKQTLSTIRLRRKDGNQFDPVTRCT